MSAAENIPPTPIRTVDAFFLFASIFNILFDGLKRGLPDKPPSKLMGFFKVFGLTVVLVAIIPDTLFSSHTLSISIKLFSLRSGAILIKIGTCLSKETFIATGVTIACIIDLSRLSIYFSELNYETINQSSSTLLVAIICAFSGAYFGKKMLRKITIQIVNYCVIVMLIFLSIAMALGII